MGAIDPQLAQLASEDANADATKQIPSLSQAVPPQPQHPVCAVPCSELSCDLEMLTIYIARHAGSVPFPTAARSNVPGLRPADGIRRTRSARAAPEDRHRMPIL